jgi:hypothetical protein
MEEAAENFKEKMMIEERLMYLAHEMEKMYLVTEEEYCEMTLDELQSYDIILSTLESEYDDLLDEHSALDFIMYGSGLDIRNCPEEEK